MSEVMEQYAVVRQNFMADLKQRPERVHQEDPRFKELLRLEEVMRTRWGTDLGQMVARYNQRNPSKKLDFSKNQ